MGTRRFADVAEGVRATIAAYTHALDDGRTDDVVTTFHPEGSIEIPGLGTHQGHDALRTAYSGWTPSRPQRHLVLNTLVESTGEGRATAVSDVVFLLMGSSGWRVQLVGRYHDELAPGDDGTWRFLHRRAEFEQPPDDRPPAN